MGLICCLKQKNKAILKLTVTLYFIGFPKEISVAVTFPKAKEFLLFWSLLSGTKEMTRKLFSGIKLPPSP